MGDTFDNRTGINFGSLAWAKNNYYDRLAQLGVTVHTIVGNHTAFYKNTNEVNAVDLLLREYDNVRVYASPEEAMLGNLKVLFIPWINEEITKNTFLSVEVQIASVRWGTLNYADLELIAAASWSMVLRATYLRSSPRCSRDTTTLDQMIRRSSI